jgi:TonB family protein
MLAQIIQTPEVYLTGYGVMLSSQPAQISAPVVELTNSSQTPPGITHVRPVLIVNAPYSDYARERRIQGVVKVAIEVGTNGLIQSARILKGLDESLDRRVLRVLPLFRFEPGMKDGQVVIVRTELEMSFRLF